jgi:hypothetical protein
LAVGTLPSFTGPLTIVQVYFLSTPHRWITLALVFMEPLHFWANKRKFGGLAVALIALGLALIPLSRLWPHAEHSLLLLMMLDYVWNAWHFAAQHAGISRIYGRMTRPEQTPDGAEFEKSAVRSLVLWVFVRVAVHAGSRRPDVGPALEALTPLLNWLDPLVMVMPAMLLWRELRSFRPQVVGRLVYIVNVFAIYIAQLVAIRAGNDAWMGALFLAGAVFHSVEYLAVVGWTVKKKTGGVWRHVVPRTGLAVLVFMAILGAANWLIAWQSAYAWALLTLLVSLLHYAYDGIIWRARPAVKKS